MKLSKLFHTLYAFIMAIPMIIVPLFAIYLQNHTLEPIELEVQQNETVNFNQVAYFINRGATNYNVNTSEVEILSTGNVYPRFDKQYFINTHKYIIYPYSTSNITNISLIYYPMSGSGTTLANIQINTYASFDFTFEETNYITLSLNGQINDKVYVNLFDLTYMYGVGNEPTISEFTRYFYNSTYPFTLNEPTLIYDLTRTYNDTDIGSQFIYNLYNVTDKYFNWSNAMGLNNLYDWFVVNVFSAANPLIFAVIFNLLVYWLFVSLFWLIFDVLMYVPNMIHKMLDKARLE